MSLPLIRRRRQVRIRSVPKESKQTDTSLSAGIGGCCAQPTVWQTNRQLVCFGTVSYRNFMPLTQERRTRLGAFVRARRGTMNLTQEEAAAAAAVSTVTWRHLESGRRQLRAPTAARVAKVLQLDPHQMLTFIETGEPAPSDAWHRATPADRRRPNGLDRRFTFETFAVGPSNRFAHGAAEAVASAPGRSYNPLYLFADAGLGKTHLLQAIGNAIEAEHDLAIRYLSTENLADELVEGIRAGNMRVLREAYGDYDVLLIDDVQHLERQDRLQEEFFFLFHALTNGGCQLVLASDRPPHALETLTDRLCSRFMAGLLVDIAPPDPHVRQVLVRRWRDEGPDAVPDEVLDFIADHVTSDLRLLRGAYQRVVAYGRLMSQPLTIDVAAHALGPHFELTQRRQTREALRGA